MTGGVLEGRTRDGALVLAKAAVVSFVVVALGALFATGPGPILTGDSLDYKDLSSGHNLGLAVASLSGKSLGSWALVVPFELLGSPWLIVIWQFLLYGAASIVFVLTPFRVIASRRIAIAASFVSAVALTSPFMASWSFHVLSEATTLAIAVLACAMAFRFASKPTAITAVAFGVAAIVSCFIRPQLLILWLPTAALLVVTSRARPRPVRWSTAATPLALLAGGAIAVLFWWSSNNAFWLTTQFSREEAAAAYSLSGFSPIAGDVQKVLAEELPPPACFPVGDPIAADHYVIADLLKRGNACPEAVEWAAGFPRWFSGYLLRHPKEMVILGAWGLPRSMSSPITPGGLAIVPLPVSQAVMGAAVPAYGGGSSGLGTTEPQLIWDIALVALLAEITAVGWLLYRRRLSDWATPVTGVVMAVGAVVVVGFGAYANPQDLLNMARIGAPGNLILRLSLVVTGAFLLQVLLRQDEDSSSGDRRAR